MPRPKINALYYPDMVVAETTLKKSILLFDELHFIDRPSFAFKNFGSIGCASPLRQFEALFREAGVPFYVHSVQGGRIGGEFLEQVKADIDDELFLKKFKEGLESSQTFRNLHIQPGNYGEFGNENDVARRVASVDLSSDLQAHGSASNLLLDKNINPFDLATQIGRAKQLVSMAALCSAKLNYALDEGVKNGFFPLADANPYGDLLGARYARAVNKLEPAKNKIQVTDLSFAIFDELISSEHIEKLTLITLPSTSFAMCVSVDYQTVAWNPSCTAAIVYEVSYGPEGGGSDGYRILDFNSEKNEIYNFSSDFSPGDGSTPQRISRGECEDNAVKANQLLSSPGFQSRFKKSCLLGRTNMLSSADTPPKELAPNTIAEMEKALSLINAITASTKDSIHFVVTSTERGCRSTCKRVVFDTTNKLYKELGECRGVANHQPPAKLEV